MTERELRKLKRAELLEILVAQGKEMKKLQAQLDETQKKLDDRQICLEKAGTIAEASLQLNGVFEVTQAAANQYLENIKKMSERQESVCAAMEQSTKERCAELERTTKEQCEKLTRETQSNVEERWNELSTRLEKFYDEYNGLRELLSLSNRTISENS